MFDAVEDCLEALGRGEIVLVADDADRENEGDCICAAEFATGEVVNFMATYAKGLICMPMSGEVCDRLDLPQMVSHNTDNHETAFTVSIDAASTTTGISAFERSITARATVADGVKATANRELMELAIDNLLRNAERYGGTDVEIRVTLTCRDGNARITVSDNGPGIPDDELGRVWDLFYRADASRSTEGLGIGLPLVRRIAEYHEGTAFAESCADPAESGATFVIELPASVQGRIGADSGEDAD